MDNATKKRIIEMYENGRSVSEIATATNYSSSAVSEAISNYKKEKNPIEQELSKPIPVDSLYLSTLIDKMKPYFRVWRGWNNTKNDYDYYLIAKGSFVISLERKEYEWIVKHTGLIAEA